MEDIQNQQDIRKIPLDCVGVKGLSYPITVKDKTQTDQQTVAVIDMSVDLPEHFRGTHMSRFVEVLEHHRGEITIFTMGSILRDIKDRLRALRAELSVRFPYFIEKSAPISGEKSLLKYNCRFLGTYDTKDDFVLTVEVPVTTLCPCSKAISARSAHNQRTMVTVSVRFSDFAWIEDLVKIVEQSASAEVFTLLKRADEKYLTEKAYENPRFTEDIVREIALRLNDLPNIFWYTIAAESLESIHAHSAYAFLKQDKRKTAEQ